MDLCKDVVEHYSGPVIFVSLFFLLFSRESPLIQSSLISSFIVCHFSQCKSNELLTIHLSSNVPFSKKPLSSNGLIVVKAKTVHPKIQDESRVPSAARLKDQDMSKFTAGQVHYIN